jgi:hypothetical protein
MKKAFLLIVLPALLVTLGFAQAPTPSTNTDQTTIKGCLGGSDGNYTVVEDNTSHIFKITTSSVDLKPHLSHEVTLIGHNASGVSSARADNNFAVTELNMISEHCAAAAAAPAATVSTPSETASTPPPAATAPAATVSPLPETAAAPAAATPPAETAAPATAVGPTAEIPVTPAADATPPAENAVTPAEATPPAETPITRPAVVPASVATVNTPSETASKPAAHHRKPSHTPVAAAPVPAATVSSSTEPDSTPAAAAATTPAPTATTSPEPASTPDAVATTPAATPRSWSFWLWVAFAVLVVAIGTLFPFFSRWRKRKSLERTGAPNLSFTREVSSVQGKSDKKEPRKAA